MRRVVLVIAVLALSVWACNTPGASTSPTLQPAQASPAVEQPSSATRPTELSPTEIDLITKAAVQIIAAQEQSGNLEPLWSGSGTIISPTGEIVTNCHVACGAPVIVILVTSDADQPPVATYIAEITHYDENIDLAILQVKTDMDGNPVSPTDLPYLGIGDSDALNLGDPIRIFGYPGVGGETITYTAGSVSGFESADVQGQSQRVIIKTDASIASGNSGGTAVDLYGELVGIPTSVNPDVREGVTIGGIGVLRPANLINVVRESAGSPPPAQQAGLPPSNEPDTFEPNNDQDHATGPLTSGETVQAYISWEQDVDLYFINVASTQPISVSLTDIPSSTDYDLYLLDSRNVVASSEGQTSKEFIQFSPPQSGTYWIAVTTYGGSSTSSPYALVATFDGGQGGGNAGGAGSSGGGTGTIAVTGQAVDANTGSPLPGGQFGILAPGVSCDQFFGASRLDMSLVVAVAESNAKGFFELLGVPRGATYAAYFIYGTSYVCENDWLDVPADAVDSDLGVIKMSF